jgi:hypothetical protein
MDFEAMTIGNIGTIGNMSTVRTLERQESLSEDLNPR